MMFRIFLFLAIRYATNISPNPNKSPGIAPARKSFPTDNPLKVAAIIIGKLGGIIGPTVEEAAVTAHEKSLS